MAIETPRPPGEIPVPAQALHPSLLFPALALLLLIVGPPAPLARAAQPAPAAESPSCYASDPAKAARFREQSLRWTLDAARRGEAAAQYQAGLLYWTGSGLPRDGAEALRWFLLAAERSTGEDRRNAESWTARVRSALSPDDTARATRLAEEWRASMPTARSAPAP